MTIEINTKTIGAMILAVGLLFFAGYGLGSICAKIVQALGG